MIPHKSSTDHTYNDPTPSPVINPSLNQNSNNNNTTTSIVPPLVVDNTTTYSNVVSSEITSNAASTYVDNSMNYLYHVASGSYHSTPYPLNPFLNPNYTNTNTTSTTADLANNAITSYNNVVRSEINASTFVDNNMNYHYHGTSGSYDSPPYPPLNPSLNPNTNIDTNTTLVDNANGVNVASTSYGVNNHNNMMNLQWHSEFPPGFRFEPKDEELIIHYLQKRIMNLDLPHNKIMDVALYDTTPDNLSEEYEPIEENEWYFFTPRDRKYRNGERPNRTAGTTLGFWKATGAEKKICHPQNKNEVIGYKRTLVFYKGIARNKDKSNKTNWIMNEYRLESSCKKERLDKDDMQLDWVLCKIHKNKYPKGNMSLVIGNENNTQPESEEEKAKMEAEYRELHENFPPVPDMFLGAGYDDVFFIDNTDSLYKFNGMNTNQPHCIVNNNPHQLPEPTSYLPNWCDIMQPPAPIYNDPDYINYLQGSFNPETKPMMNPSGYWQGESSGGQGFYNLETNQVMNPSGNYQVNSSGAQGLYNLETNQVMNPSGNDQVESSGAQGSFNPGTEPMMNPSGSYHVESSGEQHHYNPEKRPMMNPSGYYQQGLGAQGFYNPEENQVMNPSAYSHFQSETSGEQSLYQPTSTMHLDNNVELHCDNFIASPNNPSSNVPPSQHMDCGDS